MLKHVVASASRKNAATSPFAQGRGIGLQRKCACCGSAGTRGQRDRCVREKAPLSHHSLNHIASGDVPSIVHEVLRSSGQPLDPATRAFFEPRLGHDFSRVRVHTDTKAAESVGAVNALAYTIGRDMVFGAGRYAPGTAAGKELLAHELTHVVQQTAATSGGALVSEAAAETQARSGGRRVAAGDALRAEARVPAGTLQRQKDKNPLNEKAKAIIAKAKDDKTKVEDRAVQTVKSIIKEYYSSDESKVDSVVYDDKKAGDGLSVTSKGSGEKTTGIIYAGKKFLESVTERHFARRVLQVGHELEHIDQWRKGMAGGKKSDEREFLAFYHEALAAEKPGTGRMTRSTRVLLIDAALGYYYCLTAEQQKQYAANKKELLDRRPEEVKASGQESTEPPTECKRS
jgi:hypothetical protein